VVRLTPDLVVTSALADRASAFVRDHAADGVTVSALREHLGTNEKVSLSEIADKFNVSVSQLMSWNRMRQSTSLRTGQKLVVYADPRRVNGG